MSNPLVAIVGRPNVGKSTLFNKIAGRKISITENRPGVTRDRLYADAEWRGKKFTVVDTGGIELKSEDTMWKEILRQADTAIDMAQVIVLMVDGKEELTSSDYDVAEKLRRSKKPVILAVNKIDNFSPDKLFEYYALGLGEPFAREKAVVAAAALARGGRVLYFAGEAGGGFQIQREQAAEVDLGRGVRVSALFGVEAGEAQPLLTAVRGDIEVVFAAPVLDDVPRAGSAGERKAAARAAADGVHAETQGYVPVRALAEYAGGGA